MFCTGTDDTQFLAAPSSINPLLGLWCSTLVVTLLRLQVPILAGPRVGLRGAALVAPLARVRVVFGDTSIVPAFVLSSLPVGLVLRVPVDLSAVLQRNRYLRGCQRQVFDGNGIIVHCSYFIPCEI